MAKVPCPRCAGSGSVDQNNLVSLRKAKGVAQRDVAAMLGLKQPTYSKIEMGRQELRVSQIDKLSAYFGATVTEIMGLSPLAKAPRSARPAPKESLNASAARRAAVAKKNRRT